MHNYLREDSLQSPSSRPYDFTKSTKRLAQKVLGRNKSLLGSHDSDTLVRKQANTVGNPEEWNSNNCHQ